MNIPTIQPVQKPSTKAVFTSVDVENTFERACVKQHDVNYKNYIKKQLAK